MFYLAIMSPVSSLVAGPDPGFPASISVQISNYLCEKGARNLVILSLAGELQLFSIVLKDPFLNGSFVSKF